MYKENHIILIGGSAGSIQALISILSLVPKNFDFTIVIVLHRKANKESNLEEVLNHYCQLNVKAAEHQEKIQKGNVYIAPANYHLMVNEKAVFELDYSEKELFSRPSINVSIDFFTRVFGSKLILVMLSGANEDGALGSIKVKRNGGRLIVQDPKESLSSTMPLAVIKANKQIDFILKADQILNGLNEIINGYGRK